MKTLAAITMSLCCAAAVAQDKTQPKLDGYVLSRLWLVEDPDGYTNLRATASLDAKVVGRVSSGAVIFSRENPENGWLQIARDAWSGGKPAYIHASRLKPANTWKLVGDADSTEPGVGVLKHKGFEVRVTEMPFPYKEHKVSRDAQGEVLVDGMIPWGRFRELPESAMTVSASLNGKSIKIPQEAFQDLFEPDMSSLMLLTPSTPADRAFVIMSNSDGAGYYNVIWAFEKGTYRGRALISAP